MFFTVQKRRCCVRKYIDVKVEFPDFMKVITLPAQIQTQTAQTRTHTHTPQALSGDTALLAERLYCENTGLYALLVLNKARGSEL